MTYSSTLPGENIMTDEIQSPCNDICIIEDGICTGCGMTSEEVAKWPKMTDEEKRKVIERLQSAA